MTDRTYSELLIARNEADRAEAREGITIDCSDDEMEDVLEAARAMLAALRKIAEDAPAEDPGEGEWDGIDEAFCCGMRAAHYEAATHARAAIAQAEAAGIVAQS